MKAGPTSSLALIIVDLQNDFLLPDGAYGRGGAVSETAQDLPPRVANAGRAVKAGGDFAPGSAGQASVAELQPLIDVSVYKVAYSAFFNTQLDWVLRHAGIDTVAVCGIVTNGGVASTVRDAHMREYITIVLSDCRAAFKPEVHATALADMGTLAQLMRCDELVQSLSTAAQ